MKSILRSIAAYILRKCAADALVEIQATAYAKGKDSDKYKLIISVVDDVATIGKTVAEAGQDPEFTEEERTKSREMWQKIADGIADLLTAKGE